MDIHNFSRRLERAELSLEEMSLISRRNADLIRGFAKHCAALGLGNPRITKYLNHLKLIAEKLKKDFDKATKEDIEKLVYEIETSNYSPWTKMDYRVIIKRFYRWLRGNDEEYPPEVKWIKTTMKEKDKVLPRDLPTEDEIKRLIDATDNPRDRAFIMTLYETGGGPPRPSRLP